MTDNFYYLIHFFQGVPKAQNVQLSIKEILKKLDKLNKSNPLMSMTNGSKNKKLHFTDFNPHGLTPQQWAIRYTIAKIFIK